MDRRIPHSLGSVILLVGAFLIGSVLHQSFVVGSTEITSPASVLGLAVGVVLIAAGRRVERRFEPAAYTRSEEEDGDDGDERVEEMAGPVRDEWLEGRDRDESYDE